MKTQQDSQKYSPSLFATGVITLLVALTTACSPELKVFTDRDPSYDVTQYKTFGWEPMASIEKGRNPLFYNELNDKRIKHAVQDQLISRGYELVEDDPDFIIHYHIIVQDQSVITADPFGHAYSPYWLSMQQNYYQYTEGTLVIDLMKAGTNDLVWRGWAISIIDETYEAQEMDRLIQEAVTKILKDFPRSKAQLPKIEVIQD